MPVASKSRRRGVPGGRAVRLEVDVSRMAREIYERLKVGAAEVIAYWRDKHPRVWRANREHFIKALSDENLRRAARILAERPRKERVVLGLWHNEGARWHRSEIIVKAYRDGRVVAYRGYKLDKEVYEEPLYNPHGLV